MKSSSQPISFSIPKKQTKFIDNYLPWLASLLAHVLIFLGLVLSTIYIKTEELPSQVIGPTYLLVIEQKSQVETPATISSQIEEDLDRLDANGASDPAKKTLSDDEGDLARHDTRKATISLNAEFTGTTNQVRHKLTELSAKNSENLPPNFGQPLADEKVFLPNARPSQINNGKTEILRTIAKREVRSGPKQLVDRRNFSDEMKNLLQSTTRKNTPTPNTKDIPTRCIFKPLVPQASLPDDNTTDHFDRWGPNQTIRISNLVGHGRYVQPSTSVRVSDLLNGIPQMTPMRRFNESVTISELLRGPEPKYQSSCK